MTILDFPLTNDKDLNARALVAHDSYKDSPDHRDFTEQDDTTILDDRMRRVTGTSTPEDEAFRAVEKVLVPMEKDDRPAPTSPGRSIRVSGES